MGGFIIYVGGRGEGCHGDLSFFLVQFLEAPYYLMCFFLASLVPYPTTIGNLRPLHAPFKSPLPSLLVTQRDPCREEGSSSFFFIIETFVMAPSYTFSHIGRNF